MRKLALFVGPFAFGIYACATAGGEDLGDDPAPIGSAKDAGIDANTTRPKDGGGTATPPKDGGSSSSSSGSNPDGGGSSSSSGSTGSSSSSSGSGSGSSSSGSGSSTPECTSSEKTLYGGLILTSGSNLPPGITQVGSCSECHAGSTGCCSTFTLPPGTYCIDPNG